MLDYKWPLMRESINYRDVYNLVKFILTSNIYTQNTKVSQFEDAWSKWLGAKYSLFVSSGSTANFILIAALMELYGIKPGDKVLVPACTWMTNVAPPKQLGLRLVFCDINLGDYSFDDTQLGLISEQHPDIKLIFLTHLLGIPVNHSRLQKYFPSALIVDDVCESHGCVNETGAKVGADSLGATYSFYYGHHMTTIEGGMVSTNNADLYDLMKMKRSHGMARHSINYTAYATENPDIDRSFLFVTDGYNFRNTEINAVLGLSQLKRLDACIQTRRDNYDVYASMVNLFPRTFYPVQYHSGNNCFCFPFICRSKEIKESLLCVFKRYGIEYRPIVSGNLLKQPFLRDDLNVIRCSNYENADILHMNGIYIGNNQFVTKKDMEHLCNIIADIGGIS